MSTRTATKRPVKVVTREETAEVVVNETSTAEATARELAVSFASENTNRDERLFDQARIAFAGVSTGAKPNDIAKATAKAMADTFPEESRAWAEATSVTEGGAKVSRVTITQRSDAYGAILRAGITVPTVELVAVAFRAFTSKGAPGLADAHTALIKETLALDESEREAHYLANARRVSAEVVARKKAVTDAAHSEKSAASSADAKSEAVVENIELDDVTGVIAFIRASVARPWSDDDKALLMAALSEITGE